MLQSVQLLHELRWKLRLLHQLLQLRIMLLLLLLLLLLLMLLCWQSLVLRVVG